MAKKRWRGLLKNSMSKLNFSFYPDAITDIEDAMSYYRNVSEELPDRFFKELQQYIDSVCLYPELFRNITVAG